jgi:AraC family transcriptional regulator of adaptative response/methylated-DNA-[protein]-cysteine methyltransferase
MPGMSDYERIARILHYLDERHSDQPNLATLARRAGLSPFHFHRLFTRWAGITPKDFLQCLTLSHVKRLLREGASVLNAALDSGLSGPGRLHDLCVSLEAASPGECKSGGADWMIRAGFADSPFGTCLVGESRRGVCHLSFVESVSREAGEAAIQQDWPRARIQWDDVAATLLVAPLFRRPEDSETRLPLRAFVRGTDFQVRVWRALLCVSEGTLVSYGRLAAAIGSPAASRAVAAAVSRNPLAFLIPCHRVIRETGALGGYQWGPTRKRAMVAWESSSRFAEEPQATVESR